MYLCNFLTPKAQNIQLSSLSISGPSGQSPIQLLQSSSQQNVSQNQNQSQTLNSYFAYSIIAQSGASTSQNSSNSTMGVIVSDSTFQLQDICFVRFVLASPGSFLNLPFVITCRCSCCGHFYEWLTCIFQFDASKQQLLYSSYQRIIQCFRRSFRELRIN